MTTCSVQAIATHTHPTLALMGSGSGSRTAGSGSNSSSGSSPPIKTEPVQSPSTSTSSGPVSPNVRRTPPVGLLNTCNLVQDEKLVVATLATLNSGDPSNIIKQDLRLIIQSRRKAEGKGELTVDFKTPPKDELTEEEEERARKRRDQNRLAAQRFRLKQRKLSSTLSERVRKLERANTKLRLEIESLESEKYSLYSLCCQHIRECKNFDEKLRLQLTLRGGFVIRDCRRWPT